jgi:chloramphenicol-sensitive protein RarD
MSEQREFKAGVVAAAGAYFCWGLFPLFWKLLPGIAALELMAHRIVWCTVTMLVVLAVTGQLRFWRDVPRRILLTLAVSALLIALNWWIYIWAIVNGRIVESSLGYFINPLVSVVFGVVFLHERLNKVQLGAVAMAACGVLYMTIQTGAPPWIALALALTFGSYGLIRKLAAVDAARGLTIESTWLFIPAACYLGYSHMQHTGALGQMGIGTDALLLVTGPITAVPLLLFAFGARRIPLSLAGILQYIGPTLQFLSGVFIFNEPFSQTQLVGFGLIWLALAIYASDGLLRYRRSAARA